MYPGVEEQTGQEEHVAVGFTPPLFRRVRREASPSLRSEPDATPRLSRGETLILVLLLSLGVWALIRGLSRCWQPVWVAVSPDVRRHQSTAFRRGAVPSR